MLVRRPQLDAVEADVGEILDQRGEVPVLRDVVGDGAEFQAFPGSRSDLRLSLRPGDEAERRKSGDSREELASFHGSERLAHFGGA
jgi:hypothetical protein